MRYWNPSSSKSISDHESNTEPQPFDAPTEPSVGKCAGFCANQPENCNIMQDTCGGCPVCHHLNELEESNNEPQPFDAPTEPPVGKCAGFCANQPENCNIMQDTCGGCPVCHHL